MGESQDNGMLALQLTVNGREHATQVHYLTTLLILLREHLGLNGTKIGCGHGQCGACTVLIDGERKLSCLTFAATMEGRTVTTIEGLSTADSIHPMQAAFLRHEAYQCGYCTPGQILSAIAVLKEGKTGSREEVAEAMSGNLCRCGTYEHIVEAVLEMAALQETGR